MPDPGTAEMCGESDGMPSRYPRGIPRASQSPFGPAVYSQRVTAAVILVHGLRTSATLWRYQVEQLEARGIPVTAIDLPGHGSRLRERFSWQSALDAVDDAVIDARRATGERPYLVGFSLGGYLSIDWVARNPGRVRGLLASSCGTEPPRLVLDGWRVLARLINRFPDRGLALNNLAVRAFVPQPGAHDVIAGGVALDVMDDVLRALHQVSPVASLRRIDVPVLFVNGRFDHIRLHDRRIAAAAARGRLITVAGSTHMVPVIRPAEFTAAMLEGYAETVPAPRGGRLPDAREGW